MDFQLKLAAFDLDGTLAESKQPATPAMGALLARLLEKMPVAVMSGQSFARFEEQFLASLPPETKFERLYLFPTSAAQCWIYGSKGWRALWSLSLTADEKSRIIEAMHASLKAVGLAEEPPKIWSERIEDRGGQVSFSALGQKAPLPEKLAWKKEYEPKRVALYKDLAGRLPDFSVSLAGSTTVDVTRKDITKPYGLNKLAELTGIPTSSMLYVGDALYPGGNDYLVLEAGIPTREVQGPEETAAVIQEMLGS